MMASVKTSAAKMMAIAVLLGGWACERSPDGEAHAGTVSAPRPVLDKRGDDGKGTRIIVTHPSQAVLDNIRTLLDMGILDIPDVRIVGIFSSSEQSLFLGARSWRSGSRDRRFVIQKAPCDVTAGREFGPNDCSGYFNEIMKNASGVIFSGGADIQPELYGEETSLLTQVGSPIRHRFEVSFAGHLFGTTVSSGDSPGDSAGMKALLSLRANVPVIAICLGLQTVNVATGGTLIQDIPFEIYGANTVEAVLALPADSRHRAYRLQLDPSVTDVRSTRHSVVLTPEKWPFEVQQRPGDVVSVHHQAVERLGRGWEVIATSSDGKVVEAMRHVDFPNVLAVQFHPEYRIIWATGQSDELFDAPSVKFNRDIWKWFGAKASSTSATSRNLVDDRVNSPRFATDEKDKEE